MDHRNGQQHPNRSYGQLGRAGAAYDPKAAKRRNRSCQETGQTFRPTKNESPGKLAGHLSGMEGRKYHCKGSHAANRIEEGQLLSTGAGLEQFII